MFHIVSAIDCRTASLRIQRSAFSLTPLSRIHLFLQFRWRYPFEFNISRFTSSLNLPPSHPNAPHPAFVSAVLLHGCLYAEEPLREFESQLVADFHHDIKHSLANADRLFDCIKASAYFGCYLYGKCRWVASRASSYQVLSSSMFTRMTEAHYFISSEYSSSFPCPNSD